MILTLKAASMECHLGLLDSDGQQLDHELWQSGRELSDGLLTHIELLIKKNKLDFKDLTGVIVYEGPGSFTSLRIGLMVSNTIAYAQNIPIVGATGDDWVRDGLAKLQTAKPGDYVMPEYGAEANITKPKK